MAEFVVALSDPRARDPEVSGAKGAGLARVIRARVPVPEGFVVTTAAFRAVAARLEADVSRLGDSRSTGDRALRAAGDRIRGRILETPFPRGAVADIRAAWERMGRPPVSVRSSSTAEDLAGASFAGQYDSLLNVVSFKGVLAGIKQVWASLHSPHAIGYRRRNGIAHPDAAMAVVVQVQLDPDAAGVLFTRDPVTGQAKSVVTAALGLGEGVVAGTAPADRFVLSPRAGKVLEAELAEKKAAVRPLAAGGIETAPVGAKMQAAPALSPARLKRLAVYGKRLEERFGGPQDIEFASAGAKVWILQARPMTAVEAAVRPERPWGRGVDRKHTWSRRGGPFFRLEQDVVLGQLKHLKDCYDETGSPMAVNHLGFAVNGYLYVRPNPVGERTLKKRHRLQTERVEQSLEKGKSYFEDVLQALIEKRLAKLRAQRARARTLPAKVAYMEACIEARGYVQGNLHWRQGRPGGRGNWHKAFSEITGEPEHHANVYVQAIENRMTMVIARIRELARIAKSDRTLRRLFAARDFGALADPKIAARAGTRRFQVRFRAMMRVYGIRAGHGYGTGSGFETPTWNMDHGIPLEFVATYMEQDLDRLDRDEREARRERERAVRRTRARLARDPERLERFNGALKEAVIGVRFLEDHNYYMEQCTIGTMREAIHLVGRAFAERGQIDEPDDIIHFSVEEIRAAARRAPADLRPLVLRRTRELERRRRMNAPATVGKKPKKPRGGPEEGEKKVGLDGSLIRGESASSGQATGRAVVARPGQPHPQIRPGDILVAPNVGPDWTPLFATIGGLVLDEGSLSQHAALVAREYKVPSVMRTREASKVIRDGQHVRVEGSAGTVELLYSADA